MVTSQRLRLKDVRSAYRLLGECRDLGRDSRAWRTHMLRGLGRLVGAQLGLSLEIHGLSTAEERLVAPVDFGFADLGQQALWADYQRENGQKDDPFHRWYDGWRDGTLRTHNRERVIDSAPWYRSPHFNRYIRRCGLDDRITSSLRHSPERRAPVNTIVLHRSSADGPYSRRDVRLVHLFHHELGRMIGSQLAPPSQPPAPRLPPRLQQVLLGLSRGESEKQIALRLGISRHTVNHHVQRLHKLFGVESRGELLFRCRDLLPPL